MRSFQWTTAIVLLLALSATATAQRRPRQAVIGERVPDIWIVDDKASNDRDKDKARSIIEDNRHRIIVMMFFRTTDYDSTEALATLNNLHKELHDLGVVFWAISDEKKERVSDFLKEEKVEFTFAWNADFIWYLYDVPAPPHVYIIDTSGRLVDRFHASDRLEEKIRAQLRKTPPPAANPGNLDKRIEKARKALEAEEWGRAYTFAKVVRNFVDEDSQRGKAATELIKKLEKSAKKQVKAGQDAIADKNYREAARLLAEIAVRFEGTDVGSDADKEIGRLMGDRERKPMVRKAIDEAKGRMLIDIAADQEEMKRYTDALDSYRNAAEKYPDTDAAAIAEKAIDRITDDPAARDKIRKTRAEHEADRWLALGDRFVKVRMFRKAREYYKMVREKHPDSPAASLVKDRLRGLPREDPDEDEEEGEKTAAADKE